MNCKLNTGSNTVEITFPFTSQRYYPGNTPLEISFGSIHNPISVRNVGAFTFRTFTIVDGVKYAVDESVGDSLVHTISGQVYKAAQIPIVSDKTITFASDTKYTLNFKFEHTTPQNGTVIVRLPPEMAIPDYRVLENHCYRLDFGDDPVELDCRVNR